MNREDEAEDERRENNQGEHNTTDMVGKERKDEKKKKDKKDKKHRKHRREDEEASSSSRRREEVDANYHKASSSSSSRSKNSDSKNNILDPNSFMENLLKQNLSIPKNEKDRKKQACELADLMTQLMQEPVDGNMTQQHQQLRLVASQMLGGKMEEMQSQNNNGKRSTTGNNSTDAIFGKSNTDTTNNNIFNNNNSANNNNINNNTFGQSSSSFSPNDAIPNSTNIGVPLQQGSIPNHFNNSFTTSQQKHEMPIKRPFARTKKNQEFCENGTKNVFLARNHLQAAVSQSDFFQLPLITMRGEHLVKIQLNLDEKWQKIWFAVMKNAEKRKI